MSNFVTEIAKSLRKKKNSQTGTALKLIKPHIIDRWELAARELVPVAKKKDPLVLRDELEAFIDELVRALTPGSSNNALTELSESSKSHGQHRAATAGYSIDQMLHEYSLLRKTIIWSLQDLAHQTLTESDREIINDCVDRAMKNSAQEFFEAQQSQLKIALARAEYSNQELEHFAAIAAHDLKSPLNTITGFLDLILEELLEVATFETKEMFAFVIEASDRMRNMIDRLLDYASLRSTIPAFVDVSLNDVANKVVGDLKVYIEERKAVVSHSELPTVRGDLVLLLQLFQNLITNGIKYNASEQPTIMITCENLEKSFRIKFTDNGIGIKSEDSLSIFKPYRRLHSRKEYQGAGLGLATCHRIMELHQGQIQVTSKPGEGTTFQVDFPKIEISEERKAGLHS